MTNPPQGDQQGSGPGAGQPGPPYGPPPGGWGGRPGQPGQPGQPYGAPAPQPYGQPAPGAPQYGQPYGAPGQQYGTPGQQYGTPYGAPGQPYGTQYGGPGGYAQPYGTPARKSRTPLILGLVGLLVLAGVVVALFVVLGSEKLDRGAVEQQVGDQFAEREGVAIDLTCADEMKVEQGATYECTGTTAEGEDVTLQITITDEDTAAYTWSEG